VTTAGYLRLLTIAALSALGRNVSRRAKWKRHITLADTARLNGSPLGSEVRRSSTHNGRSRRLNLLAARPPRFEGTNAPPCYDTKVLIVVTVGRFHTASVESGYGIRQQVSVGGDLYRLALFRTIPATLLKRSWGSRASRQGA
jgi:hypothetical protein